jgi:hypothetical protein
MGAGGPADFQRFNRPFDLFEYSRMPFGLRNAGLSFQLHVYRAVRDCKAAFAWVDDIVIYSKNHKEHLVYMWEVLALYMPRSACGGPRSWIILASRFWRLACCHSLPMHVVTIQEFPRPTIIKELQTFLWMVNFYRRLLSSIT